MNDHRELKVGDEVKHRFRSTHYQKCVVTAIDPARLPLIGVICEDGFYADNEDGELPYMDLVKLNKQ